MAVVDVTVRYKRKDKDYFQQKSFPDYSYAGLPAVGEEGTIELPIQYPEEIDGLHIEAATLSSLASRSVEVTFDEEFDNTPSGINNIKVYRISEVITGKYRVQDVRWYFDSDTPVLTTGFTLEIETSEPLTGIYIEYLFIEL